MRISGDAAWRLVAAAYVTFAIALVVAQVMRIFMPDLPGDPPPFQ